MNDKVKLNYDGEEVEVDVVKDDEIEENYRDELEKTVDLTNQLNSIENLEDTMIIEGNVTNEN